MSLVLICSENESLNIYGNMTDNGWSIKKHVIDLKPDFTGEVLVSSKGSSLRLAFQFLTHFSWKSISIQSENSNQAPMAKYGLTLVNGTWFLETLNYKKCFSNMQSSIFDDTMRELMCMLDYNEMSNFTLQVRPSGVCNERCMNQQNQLEFAVFDMYAKLLFAQLMQPKISKHTFIDFNANRIIELQEKIQTLKNEAEKIGFLSGNVFSSEQENFIVNFFDPATTIHTMYAAFKS